jgi:hypothetical protein
VARYTVYKQVQGVTLKTGFIKFNFIKFCTFFWHGSAILIKIPYPRQTLFGRGIQIKLFGLKTLNILRDGRL